MSVCVYSVFVLSNVYVAALRRADPPSKESYRVYIDYESEKAAKVHNGCRTIDGITIVRYLLRPHFGG
jgi:hypothetical protein